MAFEEQKDNGIMKMKTRSQVSDLINVQNFAQVPTHAEQKIVLKALKDLQEIDQYETCLNEAKLKSKQIYSKFQQSQQHGQDKSQDSQQSNQSSMIETQVQTSGSNIDAVTQLMQKYVSEQGSSTQQSKTSGSIKGIDKLSFEDQASNEICRKLINFWQPNRNLVTHSEFLRNGAKEYWESRRLSWGDGAIVDFALRILCTGASEAPYERMISKARLLIGNRRWSTSPDTLQGFIKVAELGL
ncbi:MAG: hypothetical protein EZS28_013707 [Streblomastix strix]|uniref:Uncharacterized protein n=1 Tax=Streblomastix strix TaxID=222440 RepID=A0A5J4W7I1_9EUKA|nr:MAG: hypothetical protein EZS28_013707 [Streblomastix strix]